MNRDVERLLVGFVVGAGLGSLIAALIIWVAP